MFKALRPRVPGSIEIHEFHNFLNKKLNRNIKKYSPLKKIILIFYLFIAIFSAKYQSSKLSISIPLVLLISYP